MQAHHFCDICKKLGKKKLNRGKHSNLPEFEVFKDYPALFEHNRKHHFVCDRKTDFCSALVFESGP